MRDAEGPSFLGIGAQKAGTTWLYRNLAAHPGIWLPREKELHYFDEKVARRQSLRAKFRGDRPEDRRWRRQARQQARALRRDFSVTELRWSGRYLFGRPGDAWYRSLFRPGRGSVTGEVTPAYALLSPERVAHVRRLAPAARILFFLRNPVERAWSHGLMEVVRRHGSVEAKRAELLEHFRSDASLQRTDYGGTLDRWSAEFPPEQIFVGFLEDIRFRPEELLRRVCLFLGVPEPERWPSAGSRVYSSTATTIPYEHAAALAELHRPLLDDLERRFGGYASWWRYCADRIVEADASGPISIPFHDGAWWRSWTAVDGEPALASGTLAELAGVSG